MFSVRFQSKPFTITVIQIQAPASKAEEGEFELFYEDLLELTLKKDVFFILGAWNSKVGSQKHTWSNRQIWNQSTERSRSKANRVQPSECTSHSKHPLPITQERTILMDIEQMVNDKIRVFLYSLQPKMEKLYTVSKKKTGS